MKKALLITAVLFSFLMIGCAKKTEESAVEADPYADMKGQFKSDKASLRIDDVTDDSLWQSVEFQFEYFIPSKIQGTLFGDADKKEADKYIFEYEENKVIMRFTENGA